MQDADQIDATPTSPPPRNRVLALSCRAFVGCAAAAALALGPGVVLAAPPCTATVNGGFDFGSYDVYSPTPLTATARLRLSCPKGLTPQVTISAGNSGDFSWRTLIGPADALRYNIFQDPAMTLVWGDGTGGSSALISPSGNAQLTIYAAVPAQQDVEAGAYSDTVLITVFL